MPIPIQRRRETRENTARSRAARPTRKQAGPPRIMASQAGKVYPSGWCWTSSYPIAVITIPKIIRVCALAMKPPPSRGSAP